MQDKAHVESSLNQQQTLIARLKTGTLVLTFLFFIFQVAFNAYYCDEGVAPDESHHVQTSREWARAKDLTIPTTRWSMIHGPLNQFPYLYHLTLGFWDQWHPKGVNIFWWFRIPNIALAAFTFLIGYLFLKRTGAPWPTIFFTLFFVSNLLMYVFLAGMVTYDNGTNFLAILGFLALLHVIDKKNLVSLCLITLVCLTGNLVKIVFLPLSVALLGTSLLLCFKNIINTNRWREFFARRRNIGLIVFVGGLAVANFRLYGINYLRYGELYPSCQAVYGLMSCLKVGNAFTVREMINSEKIKAEKGADTPSVERFLKEYYKFAEFSSFGIVGFEELTPIKKHGELDRSRVAGIIWILAFFIALFRNKEFRQDKTMWILLAISSFYGATLLAASWKEVHTTGLYAPIHGRYWFPILIPVLYVFHRALFIWKDLRYRWVMAILLLYLYSGIGLNVQFGFRHHNELRKIFPKIESAPFVCSILKDCSQ